MTSERPVDNAPYLSLEHAGLTIEGYSRAAVQSYWRVPELKLGFDLGAQPWDFMGTPTWFVSHTHLDHIAALPVYVARRRMMKMEPPTIYLPAESLEDVQKLLLIMQRLDRGRQLCELQGRRRRATRSSCRASTSSRVFATTHTIPSLGLRRLGAAQQAEGRVSTACPATRSATCGSSGVAITREVRIAAAWPTPATPPRRAWTTTRRASRRRC